VYTYKLNIVTYLKLDNTIDRVKINEVTSDTAARLLGRLISHTAG